MVFLLLLGMFCSDLAGNIFGMCPWTSTNLKVLVPVCCWDQSTLMIQVKVNEWTCYLAPGNLTTISKLLHGRIEHRNELCY